MQATPHAPVPAPPAPAPTAPPPPAPPTPQALASLDAAIALQREKKFEEAKAELRRILAAQPDHPDALHLLGACELQTGSAQEAEASIRRALALRPNAVHFNGNYATALLKLKRFDEAERFYRRAIELNRAYLDGYGNLGAMFEQRGMRDKAAEVYRDAIKANPTATALQGRLLNALLALGRNEEVVDVAQKIVAANPIDLPGLRALAIAHGRLKKFPEAIDAARRVVCLSPSDAGSHDFLGGALREAGRLTEAEQSYRLAIGFKPEHAPSHNNLGNVLYRMGRLEDAEAAYRTAIVHRPEFAEAQANLGLIEMASSRYEEAIACFDRGLERRKVYPEAATNRSLAMLVLGRFAEGWDAYEARWGLPQMKSRGFAQPLWTGEQPLEGKTIVLYSEQGLGDIVQFARYAEDVAARGAQVVLEVPSGLKPLLGQLASERIRVVAKGEELPAFDLQCPLLSLPRAFRTDLDSIPARIPYLRADPAKVAAWRERTKAAGLRVGIVWAGNPAHGNDRNRSFRPAAFKMLDQVPGVEFFALQKEKRAGDAQDLVGFRHVDLADGLVDWLETAAALEALDLLISADTSIIHVAGALGRPVWALIPFAPDWRWLLHRPDTPWYPTMRLFRQPAMGAWAAVFRDLAQELAKLAATRRNADAA